MAFDATLKEFFQQQPTSLLLELTGGVRVVEFLNVELPSVQERPLDLVLLLADETLLHIELQSSNDKDMGLRMLEYYALLWRRYRKPVRQVVVYVGTPRMRMPASFETAALRFSFALRDIREWRAEELLASPIFGDQVLAILGGTEDPRSVVRGVLERIQGMPPERRERALRYMFNLAGLRKFGIMVEREVQNMGVTIDWMQYPSVREIAREVALEGAASGVREALLVIIGKQFGPVPSWAQKKIDKAPVPSWAQKKIDKASKRQAMAWLVKASDVAELTDLIPRR